MADDRETSLGNQLWRIEQRQGDILARIERVLTKIEETAAQREASLWRIEAKLAELERKPSSQTGFISNNPEIVKIVVYGLLAALVAIAAGQAFVFGG